MICSIMGKAIGCLKTIFSFIDKFKISKTIKENHDLDIIISIKQQYYGIVNDIPQCLWDRTATPLTPVTNQYIKKYLGVVENLLMLKKKNIIKDNDWEKWIEQIRNDTIPFANYFISFFKHGHANQELTKFFRDNVLNY